MNVVRTFTSQLLLVGLCFSVMAACGSDEPEEGALGGECDPSAESPCSSGLECSAKSGGGNVCTLAAGASCDPAKEDIKNGGCAESAECVKPEGETKERCLVKQGGECDPLNDHCTNEMSCAEI